MIRCREDKSLKWKLYDYVDYKGFNEIKNWTLGLEKTDRARLNAKLDLLEQHGDDLPPKLLSNTRHRNIKKLRITGRVTLRPMLCRGPINRRWRVIRRGRRNSPVSAK